MIDNDALREKEKKFQSQLDVMQKLVEMKVRENAISENQIDLAQTENDMFRRTMNNLQEQIKGLKIKNKMLMQRIDLLQIDSQKIKKWFNHYIQRI